MQRGERESLERLATDAGFLDAQDALMLLGDRSHLMDHDGYLSTDKAREALAALAESRPYLCRQPELHPTATPTYTPGRGSELVGCP